MKQYRAVFTIAAAAAIALAATACAPSGTDGGDPATDGPDIGLMSDGTLTICANTETPPNIYVDDDGNIVGVEVDIAKAMADEMGLKVKYLEYDFSGLVPALQAGQCDVIMASLYIKPEREEIANFVPYLISGSGVAVAKDNPAGITGYDESLCGKKVAGINGATGAVLLDEQSKKCEADGKDKIEITLLDRSAVALQQVLAGQLDAFMDTAELMAYYQKQSDGAFVAIGDPVGTIKIGAASIKSNTPLHDALQDAFDGIVADGTYADILKDWNFEALDIANG